MNTAKFNLPEVELTEQQLADLISTAMADICGFDWWKLEHEEDYEEAKAELVAEQHPDADCLAFEQVWARILFKGKKLMLLETESDWHWKGFSKGTTLWSFQVKASGTEPEGGTWCTIGLEEICKGISRCMHDQGYATVDQLLTDGDFFTADAVFQYAAYGDVIFG